jgi:hypothetical protein
MRQGTCQKGCPLTICEWPRSWKEWCHGGWKGGQSYSGRGAGFPVWHGVEFFFLGSCFFEEWSLVESPIFGFQNLLFGFLNSPLFQSCTKAESSQELVKENYHACNSCMLKSVLFTKKKKKSS